MTNKANGYGSLVFVSLAATLLMSCGPETPAQDAAGTDPQSSASVTFVDTPPLSPKVAAAARLAGSSAPIAAINADLALVDAMGRQAAMDCEGGGFTRAVTQPMTGPGYVTYMVSDEYECGGPYPSTSQTPITYDLATGRRVDWSNALPNWGVTSDSLTDMPAGSTASVHSMALARWYSARMLANPDQEWLADCRDVFDPQSLNDGGFAIWADAGNESLSVSPQLPHVVQACGEQASLSAEDLVAAGVPADMIAALKAAGESHNWLPYVEGV